MTRNLWVSCFSISAVIFILSPTVLAQEVVIGNIQLAPGTTGTVDISVQNLDLGVSVIQVGPDEAFTFDPNVVHVEHIIGVGSFGINAYSIDNTNGRMTFLATAPGSGVKGGVVLQVALTAVGIIGSSSNLIITEFDVFADRYGNAIAHTTDNGIATIVETTAAFQVTRGGDVFTDGTFNPGGADLAEHISVSEPVEPGDLVAIDPQEPNRYRKARRPYSPLAVGVISSAPGFTLANRPQKLASTTHGFRPSRSALLGSLVSPASPLVGLTLSSLSQPLISTAKASLAQLLRFNREAERWRRLPERPLLALMGRVSVKATTENGPIRPGDLLVSSSTPGSVMRCPDLQGCGGAVIGKALEPLEEGTGIIKMLAMR